MLVLTRKAGEQIVIGHNIRLTVVSVGPGRVKIGVEAPDNVRIDRQEIYEKIQKEHERSADVLAAIGTPTCSDYQHTTVMASGDTSVSLHNRIAETMTEVLIPQESPFPRKSR